MKFPENEKLTDFSVSNVSRLKLKKELDYFKNYKSIIPLVIDGEEIISNLKGVQLMVFKNIILS